MRRPSQCPGSEKLYPSHQDLPGTASLLTQIKHNLSSVRFLPPHFPIKKSPCLLRSTSGCRHSDLGGLKDIATGVSCLLRTWLDSLPPVFHFLPAVSFCTRRLHLRDRSPPEPTRSKVISCYWRIDRYAVRTNNIPNRIYPCKPPDPCCCLACTCSDRDEQDMNSRPRTEVLVES